MTFTNFDSVNNMSDLLFCVLILTALTAFAVGGLYATRRLVARLWGERGAQNEIVNAYFGGVGVLYGIALGLIAVGTWEDFSHVDKQVAAEAASIAALWGDVSALPEPARSTLRTEVKSYVRYAIDSAWPLQRRGVVPLGGMDRVDRMQAMLGHFAPADQGQTNLHQETLHAFNEVLRAQQLRLDSVMNGLPAPIWWIVVLGALLTIAMTWLFVIEPFRAHVVPMVLLAIVIGLLTFLVAALDNPYRGSIYVGTEPFELLYARLR